MFNLKLIALLFIIFLTNVSLFANQKFSIVKEWKISQPYEIKGDNSFYLDFLKEIGGEKSITSENTSSWETVKSDSVGYVSLSSNRNLENGKKIFYLYSNYKFETEKNLALTVGYAGGLQIWINGKKIYSNRISRKPEPDDDPILIHVNKGSNNILVKAEGGGFYFRIYNPEENIFVNEPRTICPDFRIGYRVKNWGQIQILNSGTKKISSINVNVVKDSVMIPSSQTANNIYPGETRLIPFLVSTKDSVKNVNSLSFNLKINFDGDEKIISVTPHLRKKGDYFVTTYRSKLDRSVQPYSVLLPKNYNPSKKYALVMLLHGAWVTSWAQNIISYDAKDWAIQIAVHDRGNNRYREIGEVDLNEVMNDVKKRYKINEDEVYLAGHSMGGYGTYFQGVRHPDKWNAISPQAGYTDYFLYAQKEELNTFKKKLFEEWSPLLFAENLLHVPAYIVHGAKDDNVDVKNDREMSAKLKELNYNFIYDENPNTGHWWGPRGKNYGVEVVDKPAIWNFLRKYNKREKFPKKVVYKTNTLRYNKAYWVTIDELDSLYSMAKISAEIKTNNKIDIQTNNIEQFTLNLNDSLINISDPIEIHINSKLVFNDFLSPKGWIPIDSKSLAIRKEKNKNFEIVYDAFDLLGEKKTKDNYVLGELNQDGKIEKYSVEKDKSLRKNHNIFGPVIDAFNSPFLFVVGESKTDKKLSDAIESCAKTLSENLEISSQGNVKIKNDDEISSDDILNNNLVLFGNDKTNKIISIINKNLPVKFDKNKITSDKKEFSKNGTGLIEIYPNPINPNKYVVLIGGYDEESFINASHISLEKIPDYVVFDSNSFKSDNIEYILSGFFDKNWKIKD